MPGTISKGIASNKERKEKLLGRKQKGSHPLNPNEKCSLPKIVALSFNETQAKLSSYTDFGKCQRWQKIAETTVLIYLQKHTNKYKLALNEILRNVSNWLNWMEKLNS